MAKIIITGASGYLGANLSSFLSRNIQDELLCLDIIKSAAIDALLSTGNIGFEAVSFISPDIVGLIDEGDTIVHLARTIKPSAQLSNYTKDIQENVIGTIKLYEYAIKKKAKKLVYINSGGTIYGCPNEHLPQSEDCPLCPIDFYGSSSLMTEQYLKLIAAQNDTNLVVLRVANPYGPGQAMNRGQGIVNIIFERALQGKNIEIWGDGAQVRDYVYIDDVCNAILQSIAYDGDDLICNIGSGVGTSITELVSVIDAILENPLALHYDSAKTPSIPFSLLDVTKARNTLDWQPKISLQEGVSKTYKYYKSIL